MKNLFLFLALLVLTVTNIFSQTDVTSETKLNQSSSRIVSGNENKYSFYNGTSRVPQNLLQQYNNAADSRNEEQKNVLNSEIENYLDKAVSNSNDLEMSIVKENAPFSSDWYNSDINVVTSDIAFSGGYRQIDLKQGEDGWMYLAVNRRNVGGNNGFISVYKSSNGGATWSGIGGVSSNGYYGSISMLIESRNNSIGDSTRILIYSTASSNANFNDAGLYLCSFRKDGSASYIINVASPSAGNRFVNVSACSDGLFYSSATYMHTVVREETNAGAYVSLRHYRSVDWGISHTYGTINTFSDDKYPVCGFSNETGTDSIYIAVERIISANEHEIRLIAISDIPNNSYSVRYITDASSGTIYERPSIAIQQRHFSLPQRILVTSTKNDKAVYHYSNDGGAVWNIDLSLGLNSQSVDYTSCNADTLEAGGKDFIAAFVDLDGDSITVRNGELGSMGVFQHKRNNVQSTGSLAPTCAIYKQGSNKYAAFAYAGFGPSNVYYNMETLVTGITPVSNEVPSGFNLQQNYPNPFNPVTNIKFSLPKAGLVTLKVYDISGREVAELVNQNLNAGTFNFDFDASHLSSGVYFYRISADGFKDVKKMMLVK